MPPIRRVPCVETSRGFLLHLASGMQLTLVIRIDLTCALDWPFGLAPVALLGLEPVAPFALEPAAGAVPPEFAADAGRAIQDAKHNSAAATAVARSPDRF
jgi:hypothetical protein